jgi:hypothetical protein
MCVIRIMLIEWRRGDGLAVVDGYNVGYPCAPIPLLMSHSFQC